MIKTKDSLAPRSEYTKVKQQKSSEVIYSAILQSCFGNWYL